MTAAAAPVQPPLPCGPAADDNDLPYWEGLREGVLRVPRCASCETWRSPGRPICGECWSFDTAWVEVPARGTVFSWTRTHRDFMEELDVRAPYDTVLVQLDDAPVRLLGLLRDDQERPPVIGESVSGLVEQPGNAAWAVLRWQREEDR